MNKTSRYSKNKVKPQQKLTPVDIIDQVKANMLAGLPIDGELLDSLIGVAEKSLPKEKPQPTLETVKKTTPVKKSKQAKKKPFKKLKITDHAMLRIIERIMDFDIQKMKIEAAAEIMGNKKSIFSGKYKVYNQKATAVIKDGVVITVI
jgi:hypothetical protein